MLQRVLVAEIMRLLADGHFRVAALEREAAGGDAQKPGHHPQQRGFPGAIAAADGQSLAGGHGKAHAGEDIASAAAAG